MRTLLQTMTGSLRQLSGTGALSNAMTEIEAAQRAETDLELRLRQLSPAVRPARRKAA